MIEQYLLKAQCELADWFHWEKYSKAVGLHALTDMIGERQLESLVLMSSGMHKQAQQKAGMAGSLLPILADACMEYGQFCLGDEREEYFSMAETLNPRLGDALYHLKKELSEGK